MIRPRHLAVVLALFGPHQSALAADYCRGITIDHNPPPDWAKLLPAVKDYFYYSKKVKFVSSLQLGEWLIIEATAQDGGDDPPLIFFRGRPKHTHVVWDWEGIGPDADEDAIKANPDIPKKLAECFQWAVGHPY